MTSSSEPKPRFAVQQVVQRKNQPDAVGVVLELRMDSQLGTFKYVIQFPGERRVVPEEALQELIVCATPWEGLETESFSGKNRFVCTLTYHRLRYPPARIAHSFATARTQFYPHQFKPLLKFLENPGKRLLIADDVGLGKTIEAAYILRELDARQGRLERVLVLVPARLTVKWKRELRDRFGEYFEVMNGADLIRQADRLRQNREPEPFRWIMSYESARKEEVWAALLETQMPIDLLICDEAHRMRNPEALQHKLGIALTECSDTALFLSATPVQTSLENLWNLLKLLSPDEFQEWPVFEEQVHANQWLLKTQVSLAHRPPDLALARAAFSTFCRSRHGQAAMPGAFMQSIIKRLSNDVTPREAIDLQADLGFLSPFGHIISRTRKAEALPNRPVREAGWVAVRLTEEERSIYDSVEELCRIAWRSNSSWGFQMSLLMAYRMTASCIPAAMAYFGEKLKSVAISSPPPDAADAEGDDQEFGESTAWTVHESRTSLERVFENYEASPKVDSKLVVLRDTLEKLWAGDAESGRKRRKVVVFSYFRRTLQHLARSLSAQAVTNAMIHGLISVDEREAAIQDFLERDDINVLLTSEVGGEGIDLQKACVVINYDLPWNPMVVEQRIGRVDRIGQESPKIYILNFVVEQSIEERILQRLLRRIDIFRESIGELDTIIGNEIEEITKKALVGELVGHELETALQHEGDALQRRVQEARKMLSQVDGWLAADQALVDEINAVVGERQLPSESELRLYMNDFLAARFPGCQIPDAAVTGYCDVDMRGQLPFELEKRAASLGDDAQLFARKISSGTVSLTLSRDVGYRHHRVEVLHWQHPLCRYSVLELQGRDQQDSGAFALRVPSGPLPSGHYGFLVALFHINSYRPNTRLVCVVTDRDSSKTMAEPEQTVPVLVHMLDYGTDSSPRALGEGEAARLKSELLGGLDKLKEEWDTRERKMDQARREQQYSSRAAIFEFRYSSAKNRLQHLKDTKAKEFAVRMAQARVEKARKEREAFLGGPTASAWGGIEYEEIAVGLLAVGGDL